MIKPIVKKENQALSTVCAHVENVQDVIQVVQDLNDTLDFVQGLYDFRRGSGIAAPQIGELIRVSVVEYSNNRYCFINPYIKTKSKEVNHIREGCLSFFDYRGEVPRHINIVIGYTDEAGCLQELSAENDFASLIQHELDHLDGILYDARMQQSDELRLHSEMPVIP